MIAETASASAKPSESTNETTGIENASQVLTKRASFMQSSDVSFPEFFPAYATPTVEPPTVTNPV